MLVFLCLVASCERRSKFSGSIVGVCFIGDEALNVRWILIVAPLVGGVIGWRLFARIHEE
jgi:glycerol uptake facilitator-like aquaporin